MIAAIQLRRRLLVALVLALGPIACDRKPFEPNLPPSIRSVTAHPDSIGPTDSTIVVIEAKDPNHDTLVYDWETDARLRIQGVRSGQYSLYNTASNAHVFYPGPAALFPVDTAWIRCDARDQRGMSSGRLVFIIVKH